MNERAKFLFFLQSHEEFHDIIDNLYVSEVKFKSTKFPINNLQYIFNFYREHQINLRKASAESTTCERPSRSTSRTKRAKEPSLATLAYPATVGEPSWGRSESP